MNQDSTPPNGSSASAASLVGSKLAGYLILSRLGRGGMADVYAARDLNLDRDVAIKILRPDLARDRDYITRFRREAKAAAKLNHSNIVQVYEVGEDEGRHYIAQELISGKNLREHLEKNGPIDSEVATEILSGVASALNAAASEGITHRDIKPENLMWSRTGVVKVADFGLARVGDESDGSRANLTQAGLTMGTPRYMSPEQIQGRQVDPRSDLYSLGVTMYHLLAGRPPFEADDPLALAFAHVNDTPAPIDRTRGDNELPEWLIAIVSKLLRKNPAERFQSPGELLDVLEGDESVQSKRSRAVGAASATARLQRLADDERRLRNRRLLRLCATALLPLAFIGVGAAMASLARPDSVATLLSAGDVEAFDQVEEQFLEAASRNDPAGWIAVQKYFPAEESSVNRAYATKSTLQLARLYMETGLPEKADSVLAELTDNPSVERRYRLVGRAMQAQAAMLMKDPGKIDKFKRDLKLLYEDLKAEDLEAILWFEEIIPESDRIRLGLSPSLDE